MLLAGHKLVAWYAIFIRGIIMDNVDFYLEDLRSKFRKINPEEYYLSYSGGKDSHLLYWFIKEYAPEFSSIKVVGINTYMEHPEIRDRIYKNSDVVLLPEKKPFEIKEEYGIPCFSKIQDEFISRYQKGSRAMSTMGFINGTLSTKYHLNNKARDLLLSGKLHKVSNKCCKLLKKDTMHKFEKKSNLKAILGVKGSEGVLREGKYKSCFTKDKKFTPLWDLTDKMEKEIYEKYNIEVPSVYKFISRTRLYGLSLWQF